ncbi:MAG: PAS domain S-box protein [Chloroflexia bacterium]|nr:PAS domain S-box protein [Chloroflexia bacterium]
MVSPERAAGVRFGGSGPVAAWPTAVATDLHSLAFQHTAVGLALLTADGGVSEANPAFCRFLAAEREPLLRTRLPDLVHPEDREAHVAWFGRLLGGEVTGYEREQRYLRLDGAVTWGRTTMTAVPAGAGSAGRAVCAVGPTEADRMPLRPTPPRRRPDGDERLAARERYLSLVSHEFRTPLTSIQGYSELLSGPTTGPDEVAEFARVIHREAVQLAAMLDGMLLLDRLRSGALAVFPEPTDLNTAATEMAARFALARPDRAVELDLMAALPLAQADRGRLLQALGYLLANADDRSPAGRPIVVHTRRERGAVCIAVTDDGPPIVLAEPGETYDNFELAELERVRAGGAGMELAIVREIAHLHGGRAWVDNGERGGCTFHLRLPSTRRPGESGPVGARTSGRRGR